MANLFIFVRDFIDNIIKEFDIKITPNKRIDLISDVYKLLEKNNNFN